MGERGLSKKSSGAIIIAHSKELVNQIYTLIKQIDHKDILRVNRAASSI